MRSDEQIPSTRSSTTTDRLGRAGIRSGQILLIIILTAIVVYALIQLKLVVIPLLIALILAAAASPLVSWLKRRGIPSLWAAWITLLGGLIIFGGIIWLIVIAVRNQWDNLSESVGDGVNEVQTFLAQSDLPISQRQVTEIRESVVDFLTSSQFGTTALAGVSAATQVGTGALLGIVILFYFLKDGSQIWNFFLRPFRGHRLARGHRIGETGVRVLGGYVRGTAIIAFVDAVGIGIGAAILQVPLALPLAVLVFIGGFIPLVGATVAGILAVLVALVSNGPTAALILAIVVVAVQQLEGNFLQPIVLGRSLKIHPLLILVALTAGTILGGIVGAIIAVPIAAVGWAIIKVWNDPADTVDARASVDARATVPAVSVGGAPAAGASAAGPAGKSGRRGRRQERPRR